MESIVEEESSISFDFGKKKKKSITIAKEAPPIKEDNEPPYSYDELLKNIYKVIDPEKEVEKNKVPAPNLLREGNRKTIITNFGVYCTAFKRPAVHLAEFFYAELSCVGSIDSNGRLSLKARINAENARGLLKKYISGYVKCSACKSSKTSMMRLNRLNTMICEECGAQRTVDEIKSFRVVKKEVEK